MMWHGYGWGMGLGWLLMGVIWLAALGVLVWVAVTLLSQTRPGIRLGHRGGGPDPRPEQDSPRAPDPPEEILGRRLAMGEIDAEEYQRTQEVLAEVRSRRRGTQGRGPAT